MHLHFLRQNNTENLLATKIYFPGYTSKDKTLVLDCEVCKQVNIHTRKEPSGMTPTPSKCFEIVNCDFKGPFHDGQYVHVFLDNFQNGCTFIYSLEFQSEKTGLTARKSSTNVEGRIFCLLLYLTILPKCATQKGPFAVGSE